MKGEIILLRYRVADRRRQNSCDCVDVITLYPEKAEAEHLYCSLKALGIRDLCSSEVEGYGELAIH